jgi:NADPH2:quinone reductase
VGQDVPVSRIGEEICALVDGGGYAEFCLAEADLALGVPPALGLHQAAALPEALFTSWFNVVELGGLRAGQLLLVHGGTSGVGSLAIQIAKRLDARVIATAGSDEKVKACLEFGAELAVNYRSQDFVAEILKHTRQRGVDVILDMAGGSYAESNLQILAKDGAVIHLSSGETPIYSAPLRLIMERRARVTGSLMRALEPDRKKRVSEDLKTTVWPQLGVAITPRIDKIFPLREASASHHRMESGLHIGKLLLKVKQDY